MRGHGWMTVAVCVLPLAAGGAAGAGGQWSIVGAFDVPEGASGLAYDGAFLYCGIYGVNGGEIYRIDPADGSYTLLYTGPQDDAYGLTYDGVSLWTTDHPGSSSNPAVAMQLDGSGNLIGQFNLPTHYMSGIAWDNGDFWVAQYYPDPSHIYRVDGSGTVLDDFVAPDNQPWDVCVENGNVWIADYWGDMIYKIDRTTGALLDQHASESVDPAGIAWDGQFLWYCDAGDVLNQDVLYKISLQGGGTPQIDIPVASHDFGIVSIGSPANWDMTVNNTGDTALQISGVSFSPAGDLSCTASFPVVIPAGDSAQLSIVFSPSGFGALDATATVSSNDPVHPNEAVSLTGDGVFPDATIALAEVNHNYGAVRLNATTRWFLEISNHGAQPLAVDDLVITDPRFYVDESVSLPFQVDTLETVPVGVWFSPQSAVNYSTLMSVYSNDSGLNPATLHLAGSGLDIPYPIGNSLWSYLIDDDFDNSPKAMGAIPDVSGDGVADVIVCAEDDIIRCFNGNDSGTGDVLWEHEIYAGSVYSQSGLQIIDDIDDDGFSDVVVASAWGGRLIRAISGKTGQAIWTHDTHEYGGGGWVYQVDCSHDYNNDGSVDVLAATGDDSTDTGPKRVYCLNGLSGAVIWQRPLGGPVFGVIGVEDFTGDGVPDVVAGCSNEAETQGRAVGLNGLVGTIEWTFFANGSSVWALAPIGDVTGDGVPDVMAGDFSTGQVYGLDATNGVQQYVKSGLGLLTRFARLDDVDADGHPDVVPAHFSAFARVISGQTGDPVWTTPLADNPASVGRIADVSGDGVNDVVVGTVFNSNFTYFLDGTNGSILHSANYGTPVDAITSIPDIAGDGSWEMVIGGRNGLVTCVSGGLAVPACPFDCGNSDGAVGTADFLALLTQWGTAGSCDVDGGGVSTSDFLALLSAWGPCP